MTDAREMVDLVILIGSVEQDTWFGTDRGVPALTFDLRVTDDTNQHCVIRGELAVRAHEELLQFTDLVFVRGHHASFGFLDDDLEGRGSHQYVVVDAYEILDERGRGS